jgi:hypothetical protein
MLFSAVEGIYWHQIAGATQSTTNRCNDRLTTHLIEQTVRQVMERTKAANQKAIASVHAEDQSCTDRANGNRFSTTIAHDVALVRDS